MKPILSIYLLLPFIIMACSPSPQPITPKPPMVLDTLQGPLVTSLAGNPLIAQIIDKKFDSIVGLESAGNHFMLLAMDTAQNLTAYRIDTSLTHINKSFVTKESSITYFRLGNSMYAFPAHRNYAFDIFNPQDTAYLSGAVTNGAGLREDNPVYFYIQPYNRQPMDIGAHKYSFLYHYGLWKAKHLNKLDKTVFQYTDSLGKPQRIGRYTDPILDQEYLTDRDMVYSIDSNRTIYFAFTLLDSIYKIDLQGQPIAAGRIPNLSFTPYPKDRQSDIAYERQYLSKSTVNKRILLLKDYVVLLSQLPKKTIVEKNSYSYTVYTRNLQPLYYDTIRYSTPPELFQVFGNRFCFFTPQLKQLITYEVK
jgi:hypothetical protein